MEFERAFHPERKNQLSFTFEIWEEQLIAKALVPEIKKREKKIEKIRDHPDNEGQATFIAQIDKLHAQIESIKNIIKILE